MENTFLNNDNLLGNENLRKYFMALENERGDVDLHLSVGGLDVRSISREPSA